MKSTFLSARRALVPLLVTLLILHGCVTAPQKPTEPPEPTIVTVRYEPARWSQLPGWQVDDVREAWSAFMQSCMTKNLPVPLLNACAAAKPLSITSTEQARAFFETNFTPHRIVRVESPGDGSDNGLITGYYEPLLRGSRNPSTLFATALYAPPDDMLTIELGDVFPEFEGQARARQASRKEGVALL